MAPLATDVRFTPRNQIGDIAELWVTLEEEIGSADIMCSWTWTETWLRHFGDRVDYCFAIGEHAGQLVGIALITCSLPPLVPTVWFRGVVHIGAAGEPKGHSVDVEYNRLLVVPAMRDDFGASLIHAISHTFHPFAIKLDRFIPEDLGAMQQERIAMRVMSVPCPTFDFDPVRARQGTVLSELGTGVRGRIRRSDRGFEPLQSEWATTVSQALDIYDQLQVMHQARWERDGRRGAFASGRFANFHRDFIKRSMGGDPHVLLFRLRQDEMTIGCLYGFIERDMVLFYQSGFIEVADNRLKPGQSTHAACMQQCLERGMRQYNFLGGEARYKRELANTELLLQSGLAYHSDWIGKMADYAIRLGLIERARLVKRWWVRRRVLASRQATL